MPAGNNRQPYVEDAEDGEDTPIETLNQPSDPPSVKEKEEANVSRTRNKDRLRREDSASPAKDLHDDSESDTVARPSPIKRESKRSRDSKDKEKEKEKEKNRLKGKRKSVTYEQPRPHTGRSKTGPSLAVQTASSAPRRHPEHAPSPIITAAATASRSRPRAYTAQTAPQPMGSGMSYYGSPGSVSRPPLSNTRYYGGQPVLGTSFPGPQSPYPPHSPVFFPPTAPPYAGHYPPPHAMSPAQGFAHPTPLDYFNQQGPPRAQALRQEYRRPRSAMGNHSVNVYDRDYDDDLEDGGVPVMRAPSVKKRPSLRQQEEERRLMPPPRIRRSSTAAPTHSPFAPPRQKGMSISSIRSNDFTNDTDSVDDESQYSPSEQSRVTEWRPLAVRRPNIDPSAYDAESQYDRGSPDRRQRRNSFYAGGKREHSTERDYENKFHHAQRYQERFDGPTTKLTADTLRKITRTPSQRTKSTGSRGNDSYALTARNSIDTEDMRILVKGAATLTIGDASMAVRDGAEIRIPTNVGGGGSGDRSSRSGSNDSDETYHDHRRVEDSRRTRLDRSQTRVGGRASSRPGSHVRGLPAPGVYYPPPATEYSGHTGQYEYVQQPMYAPPSGHQYPWTHNR